jgi:hypothetical protein
LSYVAREGDQAAGTPTGAVFSQLDAARPRVNASGRVTFAGRLTGTDVVVSNSGGVWTWFNGTQELVARWGDPAPGTAGVFLFCWNSSIDGAGRILFPGLVTGTSDPDGYWFGRPRSVSLIVSKGQQAPGMPAGVVFGLLSENPLLTDSGFIVFNATLTGPGITSANDSSIWRWSNGTLSKVVQEGDAAPELASGTLYGPMGVKSVSPLGRIAFGCAITGTLQGSALWLETANGIRMMAKANDQAPGANAGGVFHPFGLNATDLQVAVNESDAAIFGCRAGPNADYGVWAWTTWKGLFAAAPPQAALYAGNDELMGTISGAHIASIDAGSIVSFSRGLNADGEFALKVNFVSQSGYQGVFFGTLPIPGDQNNDGSVNIDDLLIVINSWGPCPCDEPCFGDTNDTRSVDVDDLLLIINNWT